MRVLGIETSCDETAVSVVENGSMILSNVIYSQEALHQKFGGVFPELASRNHLEAFLPVLEKALEEANVSLSSIDLIAVANKPGLMGSLLIGVTAAKALSFALKKPLVAVNHIEAHLYASLMQAERTFPALGLVISGGHTTLYQILDEITYIPISQTVDDAVGEAFDKVARLLDLPYPGGPSIEKLAKEGNEAKYPFKESHVKENPFAFSFSGLKTQVLYAIRERELSEEEKKDLAASFQETALRTVVRITLQAAEELGASALYVGGGVSANSRLRTLFAEKKRESLKIFWPPRGLSVDNAVMIAGLGYHLYKKNGGADPLELTAEPTSRIKSLSFREGFDRICVKTVN